MHLGFHHVALQLSKAILLADDSPTTSCYDLHMRKRHRKYKTEPTYDYAKSNSWSSTDNSLEVRRQMDLSSSSTEFNTNHHVNLPMTDVQTDEQKARLVRPPILQIQPISGLTPKAREMAGGRPEYVWWMPASQDKQVLIVIIEPWSCLLDAQDKSFIVWSLRSVSICW